MLMCVRSGPECTHITGGLAWISATLPAESNQKGLPLQGSQQVQAEARAPKVRGPFLQTAPRNPQCGPPCECSWQEFQFHRTRARDRFCSNAALPQPLQRQKCQYRQGPPHRCSQCQCDPKDQRRVVDSGGCSNGDRRSGRGGCAQQALRFRFAKALTHPSAGLHRPSSPAALWGRPLQSRCWHSIQNRHPLRC